MKSKKVLAALLFLMTSSAGAACVPFVSQAVLTAAQLNAAFATGSTTSW